MSPNKGTVSVDVSSEIIETTMKRTREVCCGMVIDYLAGVSKSAEISKKDLLGIFKVKDFEEVWVKFTDSLTPEQLEMFINLDMYTQQRTLGDAAKMIAERVANLNKES